MDAEALISLNKTIYPKCGASLDMYGNWSDVKGYVGISDVGAATRYYNQDDCTSLGGAFTLTNSARGTNVNKVGTCVKRDGTNLSKTCAYVPGILGYNRLTDTLVNPYKSTWFGPAVCSHPDSRIAIDPGSTGNKTMCVNKVSRILGQNS
jgi:hypothetical protein